MNDTNVCQMCADKMQARDDELMRLRENNAVLLGLLSEYITNFDDVSLSDKSVKRWLDYEWIPLVRASLTTAATPTPRGASLAERIVDAYIEYNNRVNADCVSQYEILNQQQYNKLTVEFARAIREIPEIARELARREKGEK